MHMIKGTQKQVPTSILFFMEENQLEYLPQFHMHKCHQDPNQCQETSHSSTVVLGEVQINELVTKLKMH